MAAENSNQNREATSKAAANSGIIKNYFGNEGPSEEPCRDNQEKSHLIQSTGELGIQGSI